jgi:tetratricopeptide (TPR) repeat protein
MKNSLIFAIFVQSVFLFFPGSTDSLAQSNNTISGHVFNQERLPVAEVYVELQNEVNSVIARRKTNSGGRYMFTGLSSGVFTVRVLTYGTELEEQSTEINIATSGIAGRAPSENIQQDFYLRPRKTNDPKNVTGVIFVQEVPEEAKKLHAQAIDSFVASDQAAGIKLLEEAVRIFPNYFLALERLGQEYGAQEQWESSYNFFKKALAINTRSFNSWFGLSIAAAQFQKPDEALKAAQESVAINTKSVEGMVLLGISQRRVKSFEEAEKSLLEADKLSKGKSPDVHWNLALLYAHNLNKYAAAADRLEQYLKVKPDAPTETIKKLIRQFREKALASK